MTKQICCIIPYKVIHTMQNKYNLYFEKKLIVEQVVSFRKSV